MSIRLFLTATIALGIAAIATSQFVIRPHIQNLTKARNEAEANRARETALRRAAESMLDQTRQRLAVAESSLQTSRTQLAEMNARMIEAAKRATRTESQLTEARTALSGAQADLAAWNSSGVSVDQIKNLMAEMKHLRDTNAVLRTLTQQLSFQLARAQSKLDDIFRGDPNFEPPLPTDLKGNVVAVDPKYDFVVLDIGSAKGLEQNGRLLVNRDSKLVAELKVTRVEKDRSIADIVTGKKFRDVLEGDHVITR
jgi:hypothetical protein